MDKNTYAVKIKTNGQASKIFINLTKREALEKFETYKGTGSQILFGKWREDGVFFIEKFRKVKALR